MPDVNQQVQRESLVFRIIWMLLFVLAWHLAEVALGIVVLLQLGCRIFQGQASVQLLQLGASLSQYLAQIGRFGTFNTEDKPWPFADWPAPVERGTQSSDSAPMP